MFTARVKIDWKSDEYWLMPVNCSGVNSDPVEDVDDIELLFFLIGGFVGFMRAAE